jgi:hypothetical protein
MRPIVTKELPFARFSEFGREIGRQWDALPDDDKAAWASGVPPTQSLLPTPPSPTPPTFPAPDLTPVRDHGFVSILDDIKSIKARKWKFGFVEQDLDVLRSTNPQLTLGYGSAVLMSLSSCSGALGA